MDLAADQAVGSRTSTRRRWVTFAVIVVILGAGGFVVANGLRDATLFFYNADEAVERRSELEGRTFRLQGLVVTEAESSADGWVTFAVAHSGVEVDVAHRGDPPELFQVGIPVVLEGRWGEQTFESDRILVKHSSEYRADNPDRVDDYPTDDESG